MVIFKSFIVYMFFCLIKRFQFFLITNLLNNEKITIGNIIELYTRHPIDKIDNNAYLIMKVFKGKMKKRFRIPPSIVKKFKDDICFMVKIYFTYIEIVEPRMNYV